MCSSFIVVLITITDVNVSLGQSLYHPSSGKTTKTNETIILKDSKASGKSRNKLKKQA